MNRCKCGRRKKSLVPCTTCKLHKDLKKLNWKERVILAGLWPIYVVLVILSYGEL